MTNDQKWMRRAIRLAKRGMGTTSPNPIVGAIIVKGGQPVGSGFHQKFGGPHAEVFALEEAGPLARGATIYVTLEPCSHFGKTPPCADRIIDAGIRRAVIATPDPNPLVNGKGIEKLRRAGIEVTVGIEEKRAKKINAPFFKFMQKGMPFVTLKIAQTIDGKIATHSGDSKWVSGEASRRLVHRWRSHRDAVLVGIGTILQDNPELTVRLVKGRNPWRVVLDPNLKIPPTAKVLNLPDAWKTILVTAERQSEKLHPIQDKGVEILYLNKNSNGLFDLTELLRELARKGLISILVEGGKGIFSSFLKQRLFDELAVFLAPKIIGKGIGPFDDLAIEKMKNAISFNLQEKKKVGEDWLLNFEPNFR